MRKKQSIGPETCSLAQPSYGLLLRKTSLYTRFLQADRGIWKMSPRYLRRIRILIANTSGDGLRSLTDRLKVQLISTQLLTGSAKRSGNGLSFTIPAVTAFSGIREDTQTRATEPAIHSGLTVDLQYLWLFLRRFTEGIPQCPPHTIRRGTSGKAYRLPDQDAQNTEQRREPPRSLNSTSLIPLRCLRRHLLDVPIM